MNRIRDRRARWLAPLLALGLGACMAPPSPPPSPPSSHVRVDFQVDDSGRCRMNGQVLPCAGAGLAASRQWRVDQVHAVLLPAAHAPRTAVQALGESLREAHVAHVQYGDPQTFRYDTRENGFHL